MELVRFPSHRGFSVRSILTFVLSAIVAALLWATFGSSQAHAAPSAAWSGTDTILYDNHGYTKASSELRDTTGTIPAGAASYQSPVQTDTRATGSKRVFILYFAPGVDPPTATSVKYVEFDYANGTLTNAKNQQDVELAKQGTSDSASSACSVQGVGWFICPISTFLGDAMDNVFKFLADNFIKTQPAVLGDTSNSMYAAWNIMRTIANIAFVIVFLVIIYSQLTNIGISNYGLKKLIPRLIIAAILVNLSYYIAALAIDVSNVLGYSVQDIFNNIRKEVFHMTNDSASALNNTPNPWTTVTAVILGGGGLIGGIYYLDGAALYFLVPLLVGLLLTLIFVVIILAARQAIIVILVIIAPLAFVANLLPNTEKWFEKWRELFTTMLIFFPAFALVFGGSQLAGQVIIQNAGDNIITVLFGLAVQVAPLVITPLILKLSGGLLGKIAQIANNPRKGIIDTPRNWANEKAEQRRWRGMSNPTPWYKNPARAVRRGLNNNKETRHELTEAYKQKAKNLYQDKNGGYKRAHLLGAEAELDKNAIHDKHAAHLEHLKVQPGSTLYNRAINAQANKEKYEGAQNTTNAHFNRQRTIGGTALNLSSNQLEYSKMMFEASEGEFKVYQMNQKLTQGTLLNSAVDRLETSKVRVERKESQYSTMVENMRLDSNTALHGASLGAEAAKELNEAAKNQVQAFFDAQRRTQGTGLNLSSLELDKSKLSADASKTLTTAYINAERLAVGSDLHLEWIRSEQAKIASQVVEGQMTRTIEEYKSGKLVRTGELSTLMTSMVDDVEYLAAETQGAQAAQNVQKQNIAEAFTDDSQRANELRTIAQSVDPNGNVRAEASALATLDEITSKARSANETLIQMRARSAGETPKNYAMQLLRDRLDGVDPPQPEDLIQAAMEIAGKEAQIPIIREMRMSDKFNQEHLSAMLLRNDGTMKAKGGFDLQADTGLIHATPELMNASIAGTIGSTAPDQFKDLKNGAIIDYADRMDEIMANTNAMATSTNPDPTTRAKERKYGANGLQGLQKTYYNLTTALNDPEIRRTLGDNLVPAIQMHFKIHNNPQFHDDEMAVDYAVVDPLNLSGVR